MQRAHDLCHSLLPLREKQCLPDACERLQRHGSCLLFVLQSVNCVSDERWCNRCYGARKNDRDALSHSLCDLRLYACDDIRRVRGVHIGMNSSSGGDDRHNSDANTNHVSSNYVRTTNSGNIPNTKDYAKRTMRRTRTNRR